VRGFAERRAEPGDQRAALISITAAGTKLIDTVAPHSERRYRAIAQRIGQRDIDTLYRLLEALPERLRETRRA
jgi:DNA-binding MarR family transcriptional regulator